MAASMTSKNSEPEHMKPGISELPRPPELSATSYIDVGDWLYALENPMGDLSNSSAAWRHGVFSLLRSLLCCLFEELKFSKAFLEVRGFRKQRDQGGEKVENW